mgnify:CR=1 FL=1
MPPTIRATVDTLGNITAIETFQGPRGWVHVLSEPIQRGDVPDLIAAIAVPRPTPNEAQRPVSAAISAGISLSGPSGTGNPGNGPVTDTQDEKFSVSL